METSLDKLQNYLLSEKYVDHRSLTRINPELTIKTRNAQDRITRVVFHCTDAPNWSPERLSEFFVSERKFSICSYHYYIQKEKIWHMVGENIITPHAAPFNTNSVAFSIDYFATSYERLNIPCDPEVYKNAQSIAAFLTMKYHLNPATDIYGHRELPFTGFTMEQDHKVLRKTCPGLTINLDKFRYEVSRLVQTACNEVFLCGLTVDGVIGPKSKEAIRNLPIA